MGTVNRSKLQQDSAQSITETPPQSLEPGEPQSDRASLAAKKFPIVGIGASAGGFEALQVLVAQLPPNAGMAYVIIQHMDPSHESQASLLLQRLASIPVTEAVDGEKVRPDHVYVIPPHSIMTIKQGTLQLVPRTPGRGHEGSIDQFLTSLAHDRGDRALAAILSGTLSDGRNGLVEVHRNEGFTFAQRLESAKFQEMPRNAIATGCVDFILDPVEIAARLATIGRQLRDNTPRDGITPETGSTDMSTLLHVVQRATGVDFSQYKRATLERRVLRRMIATQNQDLTSYIAYIRKHPNEANRLYEEILIHVTDFFRDANLWDTLRERILPALLDGRHEEQPLRIWIPGCATGEEVYSIAIACLEYMREREQQIPIQIFATDLSERAIRAARKGTYNNKTMQGMPPDLRRRYGTEKDDSLQINKVVRAMCVFSVHDVTRDPPFSNMDLVSCRNLLIYLEAPAQISVLSFLHYALRPSGFLLLGSSETPDPRSGLFRPLPNAAHTFQPVPGRRALPMSTTRSEAHPAAPRTALETQAHPSLDELVDRHLGGRDGAPCVIVNEDLQIVTTRGDVTPFLRPLPHGHIASLEDQLRGSQGWMQRLRQAFSQDKEEDIRGLQLQLRGPNGPVTCGVHIIFIRARKGRPKHAIVAFQMHQSTPSSRTPVEKPRWSLLPGPRKRHSEAELMALEKQLEDAHVRLQAVVEDYETTLEELRCANEEALSSNEELQSTNEELQTATEESQSTSEELRTLNEELTFRNMEIHQINNDLLNILNSVDVAILLLDQEFRIHRFTLRAQQFFDLKPSDLGRSFHALRPAFDDVDLSEEATKVMASLQVRRIDGHDRNGVPCQVNIHPYRTTDDRIEGAVIVVLEQRTATEDDA